LQPRETAMAHLNDVFERVLVINLDRRPERMAQIAEQLDRFAIAFERLAAVDGKDVKVEAAWRAYADRPLAQPPPEGRPVTSYREFYLDYDTTLARIAFIEAATGRKAIATPGAWALLATMAALAERALQEGWESLLVLEDDVLLHRDTPELFARIMAQVPDDWRVLQLGTMQLHWQADWIAWHAYNLYRCQGSSIASHAFALRKEVIPHFLAACRRCDLPVDLGALHEVKRRFAAQSFTMFPNLAIQDASDSDIGTSTIFFREGRRVDNIYRWHLTDYGPAAIAGRAARGPAAVPAVVEEQPAPTMPDLKLSRGSWHRRLAGLGRLAAAGPWRRRRQAAGSAPPMGGRAASPPALVLPRPPTWLPPLRAHSQKSSKAHAIAAVVVGLEGEALVRVLDLLRAQRAGSDIEPILLTDCDAFGLFRERGLVFEHLPSAGQRRHLAPDLDWDLHLLRRLALIRRKWQPVRIIAFGPLAGHIVEQWRASPFEDDSIRLVAQGAPAAAAP
jgi:GR25 family glycosyltransferase involved in LPS biosynthesis